MTLIAGQLDIFEALDTAPPIPPFTVYTCVWAEKGCGWCGSAGLLGGGACRNPQNEAESFFYSYCASCFTKYRSPKVTTAGFPITIDRTQKERPGGTLKRSEVSA